MIENIYQNRWSGRYMWARDLIVTLSIKHSIISHIFSCDIVKEAWDVLANMYCTGNKVGVSYLCKKLESFYMNE